MKRDEFFVLALRHDPSDSPPPYPRIPVGAIDQTGPSYWLISGRKRIQSIVRCRRLPSRMTVIWNRFWIVIAAALNSMFGGGIER